jgi:signal transduction histidine kinase/ligand-binding sensor domain-containing protein/DNA-binding NarL/FixJ family response regulator
MGVYNKLCCFFTLLLILTSGYLFSQSVREISTKDGLPQSFVSGLVQDDTSFVWIGTRNGLARYDGNIFKVFQHNPHDTNTLASNIIIWIRKDKQNKLWIEHEGGEIDKMDPVTEKITHYLKGNLGNNETLQFVRRGWLVDKNGVFWGIRKGTGLNNYDPQTGKFQHFTHFNSAFPSDTVRGLAEIEDQGIWILSERGISLYNLKTKQFTHWHLPFRQDFGDFPESDAIAVDLHVRTNGELMWGDRRNLFFFNPITHGFKTVVLPAVSYLGIRWIRTSADGLDFFESYGRVYRYSDLEGVTSIGKTIRDDFGDVKSFLVDRSGLLWLGTNAQGIHQIDMATPFFQSFAYKKDFGTDMLLDELGIQMQQMFNWTPKDNLFSSASYHFRSVYDSNRRLYLALKETVCYYDSLQKKFIKLPRVPFEVSADSIGIGIKGITILNDGSPMVVGYSGNILIYRFSIGKWEHFINPHLIRQKYGPTILPQDIYADDENIWITTSDDGLLKIDEQTKQIQQLKENQTPGSLPTNQLLGFRVDPTRSDKIWIGSYQGLILLNKKDLKSDVFSVNEGLPDNTIYSILSDRLGVLWLTTNKGLCSFDPLTHHLHIFHTQHGLPGDEFNRFHQLELPDGRLVFGGTDGWTVFNPLLIKNDVFETSLALTDLKINNKEVTTKDVNVLPLPLNAISRLVLPYEKNTVSIGFEGLEFSQPQDIQYRYQLQGYDNDWVFAGNSRQANYTKIPPGTYTLFVNASNTSGKWSSHIKEFKIRIEPPWYATGMAYLCYCIILAGLTWMFIRFRVSRIVLKQEMNLKEKEASQLKELDNMKTRFFSNITHEFRTPLTLIMGPAEQLKSENSNDSKQSRLADTIVNNARQLLVLINRLMDLSKLEAKALQLHELRGNPADTVGAVIHSFDRDAEEKHIQLSFENLTGHLDCWFYADAIERIVYNLVSNSLKFTPAGGNVIIELDKTDTNLFFLIRDSGIGIPKEKLPYIFDRYFQAGEFQGFAKDELHQGTGIGLSLVKELVNQMEGNIEVESDTGQLSGTIFKISMPYRIAKEAEVPPFLKPENFNSEQFQAEETEKTWKILLVEDNLELAGFIKSILAEQYRVSHVENGALGLELSLNSMPDLIISDVMMPVMDGYEMCKRLKEDIRTSHIPIVLLTAKVSQDNLIEGLEKGADDYLTKPFYPTELLLRIHNLLERQQKLRDRIQQELGVPDEPPGEPVPQDIFLTKLYARLDEHLDDDNFGVDQLVELVHLSRSSLHRKLKALTGLSTTEVVRNYRLKKACVFLREGFTSSDAAYKTGFGSPAYFTKCFREVYGITPGDYLRKLKA